ncbi:MAG: NYN domain-containing protein [Candidatus Woesearchaeota archaeon]
MPGTQHKEQRIAVFVDVQNMYYSAKHLYKSKVNFRELLREAVKNRKLVRAIAYVIKADIKEEDVFFETLEKIGFEVKMKELQVFYGGAKKGDWDVGIAIDAIELAPKIDVVVLVSGDGDFVPLVEHLKRALGCRVEIIAFGRSCSSKLIEVSDSFTNLDENPGRFLM